MYALLVRSVQQAQVPLLEISAQLDPILQKLSPLIYVIAFHAILEKSAITQMVRLPLLVIVQQVSSVNLVLQNLYHYLAHPSHQ